MATKAGLGWIGKCALLITKEFGSAIRLTTVLTNRVINEDKLVEYSFCGKCLSCRKVCPANAIVGKKLEKRYETRSDLCCVQLLKSNKRNGRKK